MLGRRYHSIEDSRRIDYYRWKPCRIRTLFLACGG